MSTTLPVTAAPATETVARVHWLGLKQISADTNAAHFLTVWRLPQTQALVAQTLDKLSRRPGGGVTNAASTLLRPLFDDLFTSEFYLEISAPSNSQPSALNPQLFLAVRLPADRAGLWQTNLAAAPAALTGSTATERIKSSRAGEWTLVSYGPDANKTSQTEFAVRAARLRASFTNDAWLEAGLAPSRLADFFFPSALDSQIRSLVTCHSSLSRLHLAITGESGSVLTRATFDFSRPLDLTLPPWEIPTNLIHSPLTGFTAVRGLAPWLAALPAWRKLQFATAPDQAFFWAQEGVPFLTFFAAPLPAAGNQLSQQAARLMQNANLWLATNAQGQCQWSTNPPGIVWNGALMLSPVLEAATANGHDYLLGGLYPLNPQDPSPPPAEFLPAVPDAAHLVYYQTEDTGQRVQDGQFINQLLRGVFRRPQLPSATALWLKNIEPLLGESTTVVTLSGPEQYVFTRHSGIGLTALELHLLADWLASPQFPCGLYTLNSPPGR